MLSCISRVGVCIHIVINVTLVFHVVGDVNGWGWTEWIIWPEGRHRYSQFSLYINLALVFIGIGLAYSAFAYKKLRGTDWLFLAHLLLSLLQIIVAALSLV